MDHALNVLGLEVGSSVHSSGGSERTYARQRRLQQAERSIGRSYDCSRRAMYPLRFSFACVMRATLHRHNTCLSTCSRSCKTSRGCVRARQVIKPSGPTHQAIRSIFRQGRRVRPADSWREQATKFRWCAHTALISPRSHPAQTRYTRGESAHRHRAASR
jgi:hypothetical protein